MRKLNIHTSKQFGKKNYSYTYSMLDLTILEEKQMLVFRNMTNDEGKICTVVAGMMCKPDMQYVLKSLIDDINKIDEADLIDAVSVVEESDTVTVMENSNERDNSE